MRYTPAMPRPSEILSRAKRYRAEPTRAEAKLWSMLRARRYRDAKFRRQHAVGPYVVDFACVASRLVIELDGPSHANPEQTAFDAHRTAFLQNAGWRVVRIPNEVVFAADDGLYRALDSALDT